MTANGAATILADLTDATPATAGGKAAGLAALVHAGVDVPRGFVVTTEAFRHHLDSLGLDPTSPVDPDGILDSRLDSRLLDQLDEALHRLAGDSAGPVAVRSSATTEDGLGASAAGQHDTTLAAVGIEAVSRGVLTCWASLWSRRAVAYRDSPRLGDRDTPSPAMAVLVQEFLDADVSGVLFTGTTRVLEATPGLGDLLVNGQIVPDRWIIDASGITSRHPGTKSHRSDRDGDRIRRHALPVHEQESLCLTDPQVRSLDLLGERVSRIVGGPTDLEWAIVGDSIHVLQARPVTRTLPHGGGSRGIREGGLRGVAASPGTATGRVRVITGSADFRGFTTGDILVCRHTDPAWTPLFGVAAAVVTESGGLLSHAAIVARETGLPAVVAVADATRLLQEGMRVTVDGDRGVVLISVVTGASGPEEPAEAHGHHAGDEGDPRERGRQA